jgi:hypothetical protein
MVESFILLNSQSPYLQAPIGTVDQLEELIEGYSTAFYEN